jgi:NitT/TauT family transport system substrate-binding protein
MQMIRPLAGVAAAVLFSAIVAAGALGQGLTPIRVGDLGYTDASSEPLYAQSAGIFKKYGLDATVTTYNGGGAIIAAIAGGTLDAGFSNITSAVAALQHGIPIVVLTPSGESVAGRAADTYLMKARGSKIKTAADLNGKIVAVTTLGGTLQLGAESWIDKNGGDSRSVHFIELPPSGMAAALKQGRIDAAMMSEPILSQSKADVEILGDAFAAIAPTWISSVFVASKAWVTANPDAARRFVAAMHETAIWANAHHADTAKILAPPSGVDLATFATMARTTYGETLTRALLQPGIDAAVKYGALKTPYDTQEIVTAAEPYTQRQPR